MKKMIVLTLFLSAPLAVVPATPSRPKQDRTSLKEVPSTALVQEQRKADQRKKQRENREQERAARRFNPADQSDELNSLKDRVLHSEFTPNELAISIFDLEPKNQKYAQFATIFINHIVNDFEKANLALLQNKKKSEKLAALAAIEFDDLAPNILEELFMECYNEYVALQKAQATEEDLDDLFDNFEGFDLEPTDVSDNDDDVVLGDDAVGPFTITD